MDLPLGLPAHTYAAMGGSMPVAQQQPMHQYSSSMFTNPQQFLAMNQNAYYQQQYQPPMGPQPYSSLLHQQLMAQAHYQGGQPQPLLRRQAAAASAERATNEEDDFFGGCCTMIKVSW